MTSFVIPIKQQHHVISIDAHVKIRCNTSKLHVFLLIMCDNTRRVLVYGGNDDLGSKCVSYFKGNDWNVINVDRDKNEEANVNLSPEGNTIAEQELSVIGLVHATLNSAKLDTIVCAAGGCADGNAKQDLIKHLELTWNQIVWSAFISTCIAAKYLKEGGLLAFVGASYALNGTPTMLGYGAAKAAVHQLTMSLGSPESGLPKDAVCLAVLPNILDTPMNRRFMPSEEKCFWTPPGVVAEHLLKWSNDKARPPSGSLLKFVTKNGKTSIIPL